MKSSLTAKSTNCSLPIFTCSSPCSSVSIDSTVMEKMACDLEDSVFILVAPTARFRLPNFIIFSRSAALFTTNPLRSLTNTPMSVRSFTSKLLFSSFPRRSRTSSL